MPSTTPSQLSQEVRKAILTFESRLLPYQINYVYCQKPKFVLVEKAVRIGLTYAHSWKSFKKRVARLRGQKPIREILASKNLKAASEYLQYHQNWAMAWNELFPGFIDMEKWTKEKAVYPGGTVEIFSSDPNTFRGMEGDITLDEFAFHDQQDALFATAQSRIQWLKDGQVTLISSHSHPETTFARLADLGRRGKGPFGGKDGAMFRVTIHEAVEQGLAEKVPGAHRELLRLAA